MDVKFAVSYAEILDKIDQVDPVKYGQTRNYIDGAVTYLSPYISRGVISTRQVLQKVLQKGYGLAQIQPFVKELCWRDYFQRTGQVKDLQMDIRQNQSDVLNYGLPVAVSDARTGIECIDNAIRSLYRTGYMHNHCRMYTASLVCNIGKSHWRLPAHWMYYHLLDGDWASNACSWQWVAGANSNKKYYANQENINKYTNTRQSNTYLDIDYADFETMEMPVELSDLHHYFPVPALPVHNKIAVNPEQPTFIYNYYNLDPAWHMNTAGNRILLLEPAFFDSYPVSRQCIDFMLALGNNIAGLQIYTGSFQSLVSEFKLTSVYYKEHPFNTGYVGTADARDWIVNEVSGYYPSFFLYWKQIQKLLIKQTEKYA